MGKHICEDCGKEFSRKTNLNRHYRVHRKHVTNLVCSECKNTFSNASNLKIHVRDAHRKEMTVLNATKVTERNKGLL